jgi:PAS domain S-box-containing protein
MSCFPIGIGNFIHMSILPKTEDRFHHLVRTNVLAAAATALIASFVPALIGWLQLEGERLRFFGSEVGLALYTVTNMLILGALVGGNAYLLFKTRAARLQPEQDLREAHEKLERHVQKRTAELSKTNAALEKARGELEERVKERTATLAESETRLEAIVENIPHMIFVKDAADLRFVRVNKGGEELLGYSRAELIGKNVYDFFPKEQADFFTSIDRAVLASGELIDIPEDKIRTPNGDKLFHTKKIPILDASGRPCFLLGISEDITERKQVEEALRHSREHYRLLFECNPYPVWVFDLETLAFLAVNEAAVHHYGYSRGEFLSMTIKDIRPEKDIPALLENLAKPSSNFEIPEIWQHRKKDGSIIDVEITTRRVSFAGKPAELVLVNDMTQQLRGEKALKQAKEEADRANQAKSEFLSRMSHELRTPMNAILGFAQLLELEKLTPEQMESVNHIIRGGRHLLELINEVLDISRIEAGRLTLSAEPVELAEALRETIDMVRPLAVDREVRVASSPACDHYVLADRQRLKQVLINLISNSIKYNRRGGSVTISCQQNGERLRISIADTGMGIDADRMKQLFTPFERLGADQSKIEGTGLGLAVAKRLVEAMAGSIGVESVVGQGSTFWLEFPVTQSPLARAQLGEGESKLQHVGQVEPAEKRRVLCIEDNRSNLRLIERVILRRPAIELLSAPDGMSGLKLVKQRAPDLILLDLNLPDMHGHEVLKQLKSDPRSVEIPVVVISADAMTAQKERLLAAGASEYLTKPLNVQKFLSVLDRSLENVSG